MNLINLTIEALTFLVVSGSVLYVYRSIDRYYVRSAVMKRLAPSRKKTGIPGLIEGKGLPLEDLVQRLGIAVMPSEEKDLEQVKEMLMYAGYRSSNAAPIYFGLKMCLSLALASIYLLWIALSGDMDMQGVVLVFFPLAIGYYFPGLLLKRKISYRHDQIFKELPDAIDLVLICMEAGLSFDMALFRVGRELSGLAPVLSREFSQYFFEIKSGLSRRQALINLAERNGERSLSNVVQVLLQSLKFGTDIAEALRQYATALRRERIQIAEEKGGKVSIKLTFVTILLIMPAYLLIVLGPMLIRLREILFK